MIYKCSFYNDTGFTREVDGLTPGDAAEKFAQMAFRESGMFQVSTPWEHGFAIRVITSTGYQNVYDIDIESVPVFHARKH